MEEGALSFLNPHSLHVPCPFAARQTNGALECATRFQNLNICFRNRNIVRSVMLRRCTLRSTPPIPGATESFRECRARLWRSLQFLAIFNLTLVSGRRLAFAGLVWCDVVTAISPSLWYLGPSDPAALRDADCCHSRCRCHCGVSNPRRWCGRWRSQLLLFKAVAWLLSLHVVLVSNF